jgi:hypothetical protein
VLRGGRARTDRSGLTGAERAARVVFAALVLASFAAFFITQRLKHTPTAVQRFELIPFFSPTPSGHHKQERISFKIKQDDEVTVTILDSSEVEVATLARARPLKRYTQLSLLWNGREGPNRPARGAPGLLVPSANAGRPAPAGEYHVRVSLRHQERTVISPKGFKLVRSPRHPVSGASS